MAEKWLRKCRENEKFFHDIYFKNQTMQPIYKFNFESKVNLEQKHFETTLWQLIK